MYIPAHFRESDEAVLREFIDANSFGLLVTPGDELIASHIPMLLEGDTLFGHVAAANPQARHLEAGVTALAIFDGPHAYVSPSWYSDPQDSVPTWNYAAVHAYGPVTAIFDGGEAKAVLQRLVARNESQRETPWEFDPQAAHVENLLRGIRAFSMTITRLEGKFKLSQNRSVGDRGRVFWNLKESPYEVERQVAELMGKTL